MTFYSDPIEYDIIHTIRHPAVIRMYDIIYII
jgi:hypothetical protein